MKPFLGVRGWYLSEYSKHKYWAKDLMLYITLVKIHYKNIQMK